MNLNDKSDLFFCDYSLMPLFVQENYLMVEPGKGRWVFFLQESICLRNSSKKPLALTLWTEQLGDTADTTKKPNTL